ncbi:hypothetical protein [Lysobacter sp. CA199]|uniref:hypothetical protein n=1 Tax=Lysobacter sp. CA199 TaxID=3455608 RepID=UPI003F8D8D53
MKAIFCPNEAAWGDIGTWVSGVGTWAAIVVAMLVPLWLHSRERERERKKSIFRAELAAIAAAPSIQEAHMTLKLLREVVPRMQRFLEESGVQAVANVLLIKCDLPTEDDVLNFEKPLAVAITNLRASLKLYNGWVEGAAETFPTAEFGHSFLKTEKIDNFHLVIDRELRQLAELLNRYLSKPVELPETYKWEHPLDMTDSTKPQQP